MPQQCRCPSNGSFPAAMFLKLFDTVGYNTTCWMVQKEGGGQVTGRALLAGGKETLSEETLLQKEENCIGCGTLCWKRRLLLSTYWLPIQLQTQFKILVLSFKVQNSLRSQSIYRTTFSCMKFPIINQVSSKG